VDGGRGGGRASSVRACDRTSLGYERSKIKATFTIARETFFCTLLGPLDLVNN